MWWARRKTGRTGPRQVSANRNFDRMPWPPSSLPMLRTVADGTDPWPTSWWVRAGPVHVFLVNTFPAKTLPVRPVALGRFLAPKCEPSVHPAKTDGASANGFVWPVYGGARCEVDITVLVASHRREGAYPGLTPSRWRRPPADWNQRAATSVRGIWSSC